MRKRIIGFDRVTEWREEQWLDIGKLAEIEVTSEDESFPIQSAIFPGVNRSWRAGGPGKQAIRIVFDQKQKLTRIFLIFEERDIARTQEFVLRWAHGIGEPYREIVRQQWNFSPPRTVREAEIYWVPLSNVKVLELLIQPDIADGEAVASLAQLRSPKMNVDRLEGINGRSEQDLRSDSANLLATRWGVAVRLLPFTDHTAKAD